MRRLREAFWPAFITVWVVGAALLFLAVRSFNQPSGSMIPTLWPGDYFFVSTTAYGLSRFGLPFHPNLFTGRLWPKLPRRGDVVVFALPRDTNTTYVKRVVGLPGDTVQLKEGRLYIDGAMVPRTPVAKVVAEDYYGKSVEVPTYEETLPGGTPHTIIEIQGDTGFNDNTAEYKVPADSFFMMGDNRDNSNDSRNASDQGGVGFVPFENLIGQVDVVFLSTGKGEPFKPLR